MRTNLICEDQEVARLSLSGLRLSSEAMRTNRTVDSLRTRNRICEDKDVSQAVLIRFEAVLSRCEAKQIL